MEHTDTLAALSDGMADAVENVAASVVKVNGRRRRSGSGVVFAQNKVLTASHVLEREEDLSVETADGRTLTARFAGRDHSTDLAVLDVEGLDVEPATPAEGDARVGQISLAVGSHSRGEGPRATLGVVSAVGGPVRTRRGPRLERYIQTDATPYPGFSGGPLIDARGNVLGILVSGWGRGAAFAIPADLALRTAGSLSERGSVKRGYLGILSQPVRLPDGQSLGLTQRGGLLVVGVEDGSPAGRGGLIVGDILATLDGQPVEDTDDLLVLLAGDRVGSPVPGQARARRRARGGRDHRRRARLGVREMAELSGDSSAALAGVRMIEDAQRSVVQVRSSGRGIGAGVIWPGDGLVLTNHHVVSGRRRRRNVRVALHDGRTLDADVLKSDRSLDLALLRLEGDQADLPAATVGDSDALRVGELVYAIGHPWGSVGAVSAGIVGGVGELRGHRGTSARYVRSDVALAPGNSGGPLLNARGEVVAINAMIFGRMALSIPSNAAEAWVAGERRPRLGIGVLPVELPAFLRAGSRHCRTRDRRRRDRWRRRQGRPDGRRRLARHRRETARGGGNLVGDRGARR